MNKSNRLALFGLVLLLPCGLLIGSSVVAFNVSPVLINPVAVLGGLLSSLCLNLLAIVRLQTERGETGHVAAITLRIATQLGNLAVLALCTLLLATMLGYAFVENFRPR
jgi:hypothetical protein